MFGSEGDSDDVDVPTLLEPLCPDTFAIALFVDDPQIRARSVYQERAQVAIPLARDLTQPSYATA